MSDGNPLTEAARDILKYASTPVRLGPKHDHEDYVLVPANLLAFLETALGPGRKAAPSYVSITPNIRGGEPCIGGRRLGALDVAERYWQLGEQFDAEVLDPWGLTRADLLVACFYAATYGPRTWRRRWGAWLAAAMDRTCEGIRANDLTRGWNSPDYSDVPLPPTRKQAQEARPDGD